MLDQLDQKQPENRDVFLISRVTHLITKSKRFEIGRVKNLNQSETILAVSCWFRFFTRPVETRFDFVIRFVTHQGKQKTP